jgi:hypothetical protein
VLKKEQYEVGRSYLEAVTLRKGKKGVTEKMYEELQKVTDKCSKIDFLVILGYLNAFGGFVVSVLVTGPTGYSVAGSSLTEDGGFLWVIKIPSTHFLQRGSKAVGPMS